MADVQYGKPNPSSGFPIQAYDISGIGTAFVEGEGNLGWDSNNLTWRKIAVDSLGQVVISNPGSGGVGGPIQVGGSNGISTNVGYAGTQLAVPVDVVAGGAGGGAAQLQVWGAGTAGTWTDVGFGTAGGTANLNVPVQVQAGTVAVTQVTSPWVVSGTITPNGTTTVVGTVTTVPSGTQSVAQTGSPWGVSGTVTAVPSGTQTTAPTGTLAVSQSGAPWSVTVSTEVAGGATVFSNLNQSTTGTAIKTSAASLYGYYLGNNGTSSLFVRFYNVSTTPTSTDTPFVRIYIPGSAAANVSFTIPVAFGTGLGVRATTAAADNDTTAPASNQAIVNVFYA